MTKCCFFYPRDMAAPTVASVRQRIEASTQALGRKPDLVQLYWHDYKTKVTHMPSHAQPVPSQWVHSQTPLLAASAVLEHAGRGRAAHSCEGIPCRVPLAQKYSDAALALTELKREGLLGHVGLTNFDMPRVREMVEAGAEIAVHQVRVVVVEGGAEIAVHQVRGVVQCARWWEPAPQHTSYGIGICNTSSLLLPSHLSLHLCGMCPAQLAPSPGRGCRCNTASSTGAPRTACQSTASDTASRCSLTEC